ncbi:MAG: PTS sugar transporter subunit IIA [Candidatus Wallbacteria bacterium]
MNSANSIRWVDYLEKINIFKEFTAATKDEALEKLSSCLVKSGAVTDYDEFIGTVFAREELGSTGIGENVAMPHGKSSSVNKMTVAVAVMKDPIVFDSADGKPVKYIFLVASPLNSDTMYIRIMASIIRSVKVGNICPKLSSLNSADEIFEMLQKEA